MEKQNFIKSKIEIVILNENDIITASGIELPEDEWEE